MKFRRKSTEPVDGTSVEDGLPDDESTAPEVEASGPWDVDDAPGGLDGDVERIDLGALLLTNIEGLEIRLQVDEETDEVQSVLLANDEGAVELRAFAAPRNGDLWDEIRPKIAADYAQRGGTASEREGRYGPELLCQLTVRTEDGKTANQPSRVAGINGSRWMLRATFLGRAAVEPDHVGPWDQAISTAVVRRGAGAMPVGAELPLTLPSAEQLVRQEP